MDTLPPEVQAVIDAAKAVARLEGYHPHLKEAVEAYEKLNAPPAPIRVLVTRNGDYETNPDHDGYPAGWDRIYGLGGSPLIGERESLWEVELTPIRKVR